METYSSTDKGSQVVGIIGILLGVFAIVGLISVFVAPTGPPSTVAQNALSTFNVNQSAYGFLAAGVTLFATFEIAFAGGFSKFVRQRSESVSSTAAFLVATGGLALATEFDLQVGSLFAIPLAPSTAAYATNAQYFADVVVNFSSYIGWMAFLLTGIGLTLFAWTTWSGGVFPKWLSYTLLVAGILSILQAVPISYVPIPIVISIVLVGVWGFEAGIVLLRTKPTPAEPAK